MGKYFNKNVLLIQSLIPFSLQNRA